MTEELLRRLLVMAATALILAGPARVVLAQPPDTPAAQDEFVPVSELPDAEQLPAAPLLITAYAAFWVASLVYLWFIRRRMAAVDRELRDLRRRVEEGGESRT